MAGYFDRRGSILRYGTIVREFSLRTAYSFPTRVNLIPNPRAESNFFLLPPVTVSFDDVDYDERFGVVGDLWLPAAI